MSPKPASAWSPTDNLQIRDIALYASKFEQILDYSPSEHDGLTETQARQRVKGQLFEVQDAQTEKKISDEFRALVECGIRVVLKESKEADAGPDAAVLFLLEATFAVSYEVVGVLPQGDALDRFLNFNSVHNIWPFWRQHVYDTLKKASLPIVTIPFFAGDGNTGSRARTTKSPKA